MAFRKLSHHNVKQPEDQKKRNQNLGRFWFLYEYLI
jgi:hypothetical protein